MPLAFKNHKKAKANLPVCTVYGYVCKLKFAMKFNIFERRTSDDESRVNVSGSKSSAKRYEYIRRRADANADQSKKK